MRADRSKGGRKHVIPHPQPPDLPGSSTTIIAPRGTLRAAHAQSLCSALLSNQKPRPRTFVESKKNNPHSQMSTSAALQAILDNPQYHDYLAILKGARNGLVYGFKVRFPHALIMAILFGRGEYVWFIVSFRFFHPHATATATDERHRDHE